MNLHLYFRLLTYLNIVILKSEFKLRFSTFLLYTLAPYVFVWKLQLLEKY